MIMIAHRLSTVTNVDQIFVIQDGRVAECGNSRELLAKDGIYSRMWKNYQTSVQWKVTKEVQLSLIHISFRLANLRCS